MKHITSILRTLSLVAMLCLSSANASAYEVYQYGNIEDETWGEQTILVVNSGTYNLSKIDVENKILIIEKGATVNVSDIFSNMGNGFFYVFGTLDLKQTNLNDNFGTIYVMEGGSLEGEIVNSGQIKTGCKEADILTGCRKVEGKVPTSEEDGWKDYYEGGISTLNDFYPLSSCYYKDEALQQPIDNLEEWKRGEGKRNLLVEKKGEALADIEAAMEGVVIFQTSREEIEGCISSINEVSSPNDVELYKRAALTIIEQQKACNRLLSENFGSLFTKQAGPAIIVTDQDGKEIILYSPKSVEYIKVNEY